MTMQREDRQEKLVRFAFREKKGKEAATGIHKLHTAIDHQNGHAEREITNSNVGAYPHLLVIIKRKQVYTVL